MSGARFGNTPLPEAQSDALRRAKRLELVSIAYVLSAVALVVLVMGSSQAMKAAWIEDCLSLLPPLSFLLASRYTRRPASPKYPYGHHRAAAAAHLAASVALLAMGLFVVGDSAMTLVSAEHPTIGTLNLFGHTFWQGWPMLVVLVYTGLPNVFIGRRKKKLAKALHDKVLYADAAMNSDDWLTASGAMAGVLGIGFGLWWADSVVAILIGASVINDGVQNVRAAMRGLLDARVQTYDESEPHPLLHSAVSALGALPWVSKAGVRMRDEGHVFHTEAFVVPRGETVTMEQVEEAQAALRELDWKTDDSVVVPVREIPEACTR